MSTIIEIEDAVRQLPPDQFAQFRSWFLEFESEAWDRQIEQDVASGRLDALANEAIQDRREGRCTDL